MAVLSSERVQTGLGAVLAAIGAVGLLAPDRVNASPGGAELSPAGAHLTRLWAMREAAIGAILLVTRGSAQRGGVLRVIVGLTMTELAAALTAPGASRRERAGSVVSISLFTAATLWSLSTANRRGLQKS